MAAIPEALVHDAKRLAEKVAGLGATEELDAVVVVLREHVKRLDRQRRLASLRAIVDDFQAEMVHRPASGKEAEDELYDEHGLPR